MTAQGRAGRRGEGWISVKDRLPDPWEYVVVYSSLPSLDLARVDGEGEWWVRQFPVEVVTHWMPLPAPPVADGEEGEE